MAVTVQSELLGLGDQQLSAIAEDFGEPAYRGRQLFDALYRRRVSALEGITTLPRDFRQKLGQRYAVGLPRIDKKFVSADGTIRYLMSLRDRELVETVWMPGGDGGDAGDTGDSPAAGGATEAPVRHPRAQDQTLLAPAGEVVDQAAPGTNVGDRVRGFDHATICVSSQAGCALNCQFCMTALLGLMRNLSAGEIVGQVISVLNDREVELNGQRINLVFMGMGEPFLNYDDFMKAVRLLVEGVGIAESRMTVSTAGIVPRIRDFGREPVRPKLAISLNASNDELRDRLMPINRKWDLEKLLAAAREFPLRPHERLTFEHVLLEGVNDAPENAREVVALLRGLRCKVNLIALNPGPEIAFRTPAEQRIACFQEVLRTAGIPAFVRRPRGRDIYAACGQLKKTSIAGCAGSLVNP